MRHRRVLSLTISLAAIALGGCLLPDQKQQIAACQVEADRFFLSHRAAGTDDPRSQYIIACMASKGYEFTIKPDECDGRQPLASQSACYTTNWMSWILNGLNRQ
jgi:hypothetical protein